tara:strand:- start:217 stop:669 length:453 start_codon:yes stop_codon:yes gene_type:complete
MASRGPLNQGPGFVPAYQVSGTPYVTSSLSTEVPEASAGTPASLEIKFPFVTRWVIVQNIGSRAVKMGFTKRGVNSAGEGPFNAQHFTIPAQGAGAGNAAPATTPRLELRCKSLHFAGVGGTTGVQVIAGLTSIKEFPILTASNGFEGVG